MAARLSSELRAKILADWHVGITQNQIRIKYDISHGAVNKICQGVVQCNIENVNTLARVKLDLAQQNDFNVNAVHKAVDIKAQDMKFFRNASLIIANKALEKLKEEDITMADIERAQNVVGKGRENIYGKSPDTAIQINNDNTYGWEK